ncbi:MAG: glycoside hydrolase family 99-like domain-containing protein [Pirellulales bacterium]|nr:glycoside hydrolase family 99-like domain-containing protein [Pirellulales bacterium]
MACRVSAPAESRGPAPYVPHPQPAVTDYLIGAYYYPGWDRTDAWDVLLRFFPERRPLLGWHHVGNPEVVDWQIKWAVEHGVRFFVYDWYWAKGYRRLDEGLHSGLFQARYQNLIQFCLLYANHLPFNPEDSYSPEDLEKVARFWIANYFQRPNYLKVDGRPVVIIFSPPQLRKMGEHKIKPTFERVRAMCREAGLAGAYVCGTCWYPTDEPSPDYWKTLEAMNAEGYDAVTAYTWSGHIGMTPAEIARKQSPFAACAEGYRKAWSDIADAKVIKLIPPVSGGWDCRPWAGDAAVARTDRTPEQFKRHLLDCKAFLDAREQTPQLKMAIIGAWNEWTEGSYIEPDCTNRFAYLEAIRQVFAPQSTKPSEVLPADLGLGPYDLPQQPAVTSWDFAHASTTLGWGSYLGRLQVADGALRFTTRTYGPVPTSTAVRVPAARYPAFLIRVAASRDVPARFMWGTPSYGLPTYRIGGKPIRDSEVAPFVDFSIKASGQPQEIRISLADHPLWQGTITVLQIVAGPEPGKHEGVDIAVYSMQLAE